ncbi:hypothetical protein FEV16_03040 [Methylocystis sp. B8]|nr:hypothetical protein FEV16_03040 [Methylocystis sp. B8]
MDSVEPGLFYSAKSLRVMPGLAPGIHAGSTQRRRVDGRDKPGHDAQKSGEQAIRSRRRTLKSERTRRHP